MRDYFRFVKWYFQYSTQRFFPKVGRRIVRQDDRLFHLLLGNVFFLISVVLTVLHIVHGYFYLICGIMTVSLTMSVCKFSFLYYWFLYTKYTQRENSFNDRFMVEFKILGEYPTWFSKMIEKYHFHVRSTESTRNSVRYYLVERRHRRKSLTKKEMYVLEITYDKIFFNNQLIFSEKLTDVTMLEDFLQEMQKQIG